MSKRKEMAASDSLDSALLPDRVTSLQSFTVERVLSDGGDGTGSINGAAEDCYATPPVAARAARTRRATNLALRAPSKLVSCRCLLLRVTLAPEHKSSSTRHADATLSRAVLGSFGGAAAIVKVVRLPLPTDDVVALLQDVSLTARAPYRHAL
jgi:hypothetical protein